MPSLIRFLAGSLVMFLAADTAIAGTTIEWSPGVVSRTLPIGESESFSVELVARKNLRNACFRISSPLAELVKVEPVHLKRLKANAPLTLTVNVDLSGVTAPTTTNGAIELYSECAKPGQKKGKDKAILRGSLPVSIIGESVVPGIGDITFFSGATSPQWLRFTRDDGQIITIGGPRDEQGLPIQMETVHHELPGGGAGRVQFDSNGLPMIVRLADGSRVTFQWTGPMQATVSALTADGQVQANIPLDFSSPGSFARSSDLSALDPIGHALVESGAAHRESRTGVGPELQSEVDETSAIAPSVSALAAAPNGGVVRIGVRNDGNYPVTGADVDACMSGGVETQCLWVSEVGGGIYEALFQNTPDAIPDELIDSYCSSFLDSADLACSSGGKEVADAMVAGGCIQLGAAIAAINPAAGAAFAAACEVTFAVASLACDVAGAAPAICPAIDNVVNFFDPGVFTFSATARKGNLSASGSTSAPGTASVVDIGLQLAEPDCQILEFSTSPSDPAPFEGYVASVILGCFGAPPSSVTLSMSGTDGYSTSTTCLLESRCQLSVPGAEGGVVDTINVFTSGGVARTIQLVF